MMVAAIAGYLAILLLVSLSIARGSDDPPLERPTVAMCTVARDAQEDIAEHIAYHKFIGFTKYFLLDHCSRPSLYNNVERYVREGFVDYSHICDDPAEPEEKDRGQIQLKMFTRCLRLAAGKVDYVALFDTDEFLVLMKHENVSSLMASFGDIGALAVNWVFFGSSGHLSRPDGGLLANYNKCLYDQHIKVILNMKHALHGDLNVHGKNVHMLRLTNSTRVVDELGQPVAGHKTAKHSSTIVALYHYHTRSMQDWLARRRRGNFSLGKASKEFFSLSRLQTIDAATNLTCTRGQELAKEMRERLPEASWFGSA